MNNIEENKKKDDCVGTDSAEECSGVGGRFR